MQIKLFLITVLTCLALLSWYLPKSGYASKLSFGIGGFYLLHTVAIVIGIAGLIASLAWPQALMQQHYFELLLLPVLLIYVYTAIVGKVKGMDSLYDEKQRQNMTEAAATTWFMSIILVFLLYAMQQAGNLSADGFFPIFLFFSFGFYSASTLYFFRKA